MPISKVLIYRLLDEILEKEKNYFGRTVTLLLRYPPNTGFVAYFQSLDAIKDVIWEKLNTGHWKDVSLHWRKLYSITALLKVDSILQHVRNHTDEELIRDLIKLCDLGLLMGYPILDNCCGRMASELNSRIKSVVSNKRRKEEDYSHYADKFLGKDDPERIRELERIPDLELTEFLISYKSLRKPVVITGGVRDWPASKKWTLDYLRNIAGFRTVPVELGSRYTDDGWSQTLMTLNEFIDKHIEFQTGPVGYLAQHELFEQISELKDDFDIPEYCHTDDEEEVDVNCWFGPGGTISPLHTDPKHNFLAQVMGRKYVRLYDKDQTKFMYPHDDLLLFNTSKVDLENVDESSFPEFKNARGTELILNPGDLLYIPPQTWHFIKSLSTSFSISFWF